MTATDITPRHIDIIKQNLVATNHSMRTAVLDATDMLHEYGVIIITVYVASNLFWIQVITSL